MVNIGLLYPITRGLIENLLCSFSVTLDYLLRVSGFKI